MTDARTTVHFGELLLRLDTPAPERLVAARTLRPSFTGGEVNVAAALARWGVPAAIVSKVPEHEIGEACLAGVRGLGVDVRHVRRGGERLGLLFVETGAPPRPGRVVYDRWHTSFRAIEPGEFDWGTILADASWFHFTGTAPAAGENVRTVLAEALDVAARLEVPVSMDCGYRRALWTEDEAGRALRELVPRVDVLVGSERDAATFFGVGSSGFEAATELQATHGPRCVAFTRREELEDGRTRYSALVRDGETEYESRVREFPVVDRIGAGDAFAAGLIHGLLRGEPLPSTVEFAVAAAVLTHTVPGDVAHSSLEEVRALAAGESGGLRR